MTMTEETRTSLGASPLEERRRVFVAEALEHLPGAGGECFAKVLEHGSLLVEIYAPRGRDLQQPHTRDEVYVVVEGRGDFVNGDERQRITTGDLLFVPAGVPHRFENFTEDLVVWVIFYGPEGGERPRPQSS
jgi:mannose-6-phosphate isomerase-like protein (cupin superfamily)